MVRVSAFIAFCITLLVAAYLGFALIHLKHDKLVHFVTFVLLTVELFLLSEKSRHQIMAVTTMLCACVALEYIQSFVNPSRVFDLKDILANVCGVAAATLCCIVLVPRKRRIRRQVAMELDVQPSGTPLTPGSEDEVEGFVNVRASEIV